MPEWWNSIEVLLRLISVAQIVGGVLLVLTIVVGFISVRLSDRIDTLRLENQHHLQTRMQAAEVAQEAFRQQLDAAQAEPPRGHSDVAQAAPVTRPESVPTRRSISPEQLREFVAFMKDKPRGSIGLVTVTGDSEAQEFATQIERMLKK